MENTNQTDRRRRAGGLATAGLLVAALAGGLGTNALFTDTEVVEDNSFAAGTLDLTAGQVDAKIDVTSMVPGQTVTFDVTVGNAGSLDLRYALEASFAPGDQAQNLGEALEIAVTDAEDNVLGSLAAGAAATPGAAVFGSKVVGAQAGDRNLAPAGTETLTVAVTYPENADNSYAGADTELVLTFDAEQTANN